jgi:uncharacterized membrane protein
MRRFPAFLLGIFLSLPIITSAYVPDDPYGTTVTETAEVIAIVSTGDETIPGTSTISHEQVLRATVISGPDKGQIVSVKNDYSDVKVGDRFLLVKQTYQNGDTTYFLQDVDRRSGLLVFSIIGAVLVIVFAGMIGVRALFSLGISIAAIICILLPLLIKGLPPVPIAVAVSTLILFVVMYLTHGWNRITHAAFAGTTITVLLTGILSAVAVTFLHLTGYSAEESVYLNLASGGSLDIKGLLLAGIIVGVLGVLNDVAITQSATVAELRHADPSMRPRDIYRRAMRIGREHIGGLVNTLALAYVGASLPLLLLITQIKTPLSLIINQEILAAEIVRTLIGTVALTLAVPITSFLAIYFRAESKGGFHHHH